MKKAVILILSMLIAILSIFAIYYVFEYHGADSQGENVLSVYSEGPIELSELIENIENYSYYQGYDNDTLNWMKSLGNKSVFSGNATFVIMDSHDAEKIPSQYVTDVFITEDFSCDILENRSLGNIKYPKDVLLVDNVEYLQEHIIDIPGGGA